MLASGPSRPRSGFCCWSPSVALSSNGNTALAGIANTQTGTPQIAEVFTRNSGVWNLGIFLQASGSQLDRGETTVVSLSADGNTAIVGSPFDNNSWTCPVFVDG